MRTIELGKQGLRIPPIGLGCMGMSEFYSPSDETQAHATLDMAIEIGCTFWDTADIYGPFKNEELLGKSLIGRRDKVVLATKFGIQRNELGEWLGISGQPEYVQQSCEASLLRLKTDYIDLYYQHRVDPNVPIEETVGAMAKLVEQGKVRFLGLSEADPQTLRRAHAIHPISALQTEYSLWSREIENDMLPTTRELAIGFVAYSPLGRGFLTGTIESRADLQENDWRLTNPRFQEEALHHNLTLVREIQRLANRKGITPAQMALAWLLTRSDINGDNIALIPGTKHIDYLTDNWQSMNIRLTGQELQYLDQISSKHETAGNRY